MERPGSVLPSFNVTGITRDKEYDSIKGIGKKQSVFILPPMPMARPKLIESGVKSELQRPHQRIRFLFLKSLISGRGSIGNQVTSTRIKAVKFKEAGVSNLAGKKLGTTTSSVALNTEEKN